MKRTPRRTTSTRPHDGHSGRLLSSDDSVRGLVPDARGRNANRAPLSLLPPATFLDHRPQGSAIRSALLISATAVNRFAAYGSSDGARLA